MLRFLLSCLFVLVVTLSVEAGYCYPAVCCETPPLCREPWRLYAGYRYMGIRARDNLGLTVPATRNEELWGGQVGGWYLAPYRLFGQIEAVWDTMSPKVTEETSWRFRHTEVTGRLGVAIGLDPCRTFLIIPFGGFAFRQFIDQAGFVSPFFLQERLIYSTYFVPIGVMFNWHYYDCFEFGALYQHGVAVRTRLRTIEIDETRKIETSVRFPVRIRDSVLLEAYFRILGRWCRGIAFEVSLIPFYEQIWYGSVHAPSVPALEVPRRINQYYGGRIEGAIRF